MNVACRSVYSELDDVTFPPHVILKSTHNTPIEGFWRWFHDKAGKNLKEVLLRGQTEYIFNAAYSAHSLSILFLTANIMLISL